MLRKIKIFLVYTVGIFLALELALYILDIPKDYKPHSNPVQFQEVNDKEMGYINYPSTSIDFVYDRNPRGYFHYDNTVQHVTNSVGLRGPELPTTKDDNTYRILFLGDSVTFGEGVYFKDTFPEQFKKLAQEKNLFGGKNIEAINMGVGGYNTAQEFALLKSEEATLHLKPDRIVVTYNMNDAETPIFQIDASGQLVRRTTSVEAINDKYYYPSGFFRISRTFRIIRDWFYGSKITKQIIQRYQNIYNDSNPDWIKTQEAFTNFSDFSKSTGIPVTIAVMPRLFQLDNYPFQAQRNKILDALTNRGLDTLQLLPYFANYKDSDLWVHPTDQHPNEIADRIIAQALVDKFSDQ